MVANPMVFVPNAVFVSYTKGGGVDQKVLQQLVGYEFSDPYRPNIVRKIVGIDPTMFNVDYVTYDQHDPSKLTKRGTCYWYSFYRWCIGDRHKSGDDYLDCNGNRLQTLDVHALRREVEQASDSLDEIEAALSADITPSETLAAIQSAIRSWRMGK